MGAETLGWSRKGLLLLQISQRSKRFSISVEVFLDNRQQKPNNKLNSLFVFKCALAFAGFNHFWGCGAEVDKLKKSQVWILLSMCQSLLGKDSEAHIGPGGPVYTVGFDDGGKVLHTCYHSHSYNMWSLKLIRNFQTDGKGSYSLTV